MVQKLPAGQQLNTNYSVTKLSMENTLLEKKKINQDLTQTISALKGEIADLNINFKKTLETQHCTYESKIDDLKKDYELRLASAAKNNQDSLLNFKSIIETLSKTNEGALDNKLSQLMNILIESRADQIAQIEMSEQTKAVLKNIFHFIVQPGSTSEEAKAIKAWIFEKQIEKI